MVDALRQAYRSGFKVRTIRCRFWFQEQAQQRQRLVLQEYESSAAEFGHPATPWFACTCTQINFAAVFLRCLQRGVYVQAGYAAGVKVTVNVNVSSADAGHLTNGNRGPTSSSSSISSKSNSALAAGPSDKRDSSELQVRA
jgi:hypothetical protein